MDIPNPFLLKINHLQMPTHTIQSHSGNFFSVLGNSHINKNRDENIPVLPNLTAYEDYKPLNTTFY